VPPSPEKKIRNRIYVGCGVIMLACIGSIALYYVLLQNTFITTIKPVFWLESLALWAFGWSWFVKGETLWRDAEEALRPARREDGKTSFSTRNAELKGKEHVIKMRNPNAPML
jgi:hypothetical protein